MRHSAEPDPDRGDIDGPAPDEVTFAGPGGDGAVLAELAEGPLDGVALLVSDGVEAGGRPPALPRRSRLRTWPAGWGIVALIPRRRRCARIALAE
jgi:hypothetical protein